MNSLFLIVMSPVCWIDDELFIETHTNNGVLKWAENFDKLTVLLPELHKNESIDYYSWEPVQKLHDTGKIIIISVPSVYRFVPFFYHIIKHYPIIKDEITNSRYQVFSIGGVAGDWGAFAALYAAKNRIKYAIWTDRVEHNVIKAESRKKNIPKRIYNRLINYNIMKYYHRFIISKAHVGLFHGNDCFNEYSKYNKNPHLVYNLHFKEEDQISLNQLHIKKDRILSKRKLKICYAGRMTEMKGPEEWLKILYQLKLKKVKFEATWLGDGPSINLMKEKVTQYDLKQEVSFPGYIKDITVIKNELQDSDIFLFCHKTKESPRNLIEALKAACPIIGFYSEYAEDLIKENNGGILIKEMNVDRVTSNIDNIWKNREELFNLMDKSYKDGMKFSDTSVFRHRSDIIKNNL